VHSDYQSPKPIRVAIVHYRDDPSAGGSLRVGETLANHLEPNQVEAHLVFAYGGPGAVSRNARVPCHYLEASGPLDLRGWWRSRRFFRNLAPDVIHFQDGVNWLRAALAGTGVPAIDHVHGRYLPEYMSRTDRILAKVRSSVTCKHICISEASRQTLLALGWGKPERASVVYNSIDVDYFSRVPLRWQARKHLGIPSDAKVAGMVCRLTRYKGCDDAIRMLPYLGDKWHLLLCGVGPFGGDLVTLSKARSVVDRIHFAGCLDDTRWAYAAMDVYLMLSRYEPFGLVLCEAMAAGIPVFGLQGHGEYSETENPLLTSDNSALLQRANAGDYDAPEDENVIRELALRILDADRNPYSQEIMVQNGRRSVARFDCKIQVDAMTKIYRDVARQKLCEDTFVCR
jgi:glycosyltransferase involved in cell wall biosynthesis